MLHQCGDVRRLHPRLDAAVDPAERLDGHGVRDLHEIQLGTRFDHPAGAHQRLTGYDLIRARKLVDSIDDEKAHRGLGRNRAGGDAAVAKALNDALDGALVLVPGPYVASDLERLPHRGLLERGSHDDDLPARGNDGEGDALRSPPVDAREIVEGRAWLDDERGDLLPAHEALELGNTRPSFLDRDGLGVRGQALELGRRSGRSGGGRCRRCAVESAQGGGQGGGGGAAQQFASREHGHPFVMGWTRPGEA